MKNPDGSSEDDMTILWAYYDSTIDTKYTVL